MYVHYSYLLHCYHDIHLYKIITFYLRESIILLPISLYLGLLELTVVVVLEATSSSTSSTAAPAEFTSAARLLRIPALLARIPGSRLEALALSLALALCVRCVVVATTSTKVRGHINTTGDRISGSLACYGAAVVSRAAIQVQTSNLERYKEGIVSN